MNTDCCILISTCDKYVDLAKLTVDLIHQRWKNHPAIFICGISSPFSEMADFLLLEHDSRDWIGITDSAATQLLKKGYRKCYLILDDHPPLQTCNEIHLNLTLPVLMENLNAAYIGLHGWGQNTLSDGKVLGTEYHRLQRQSDSFLWRYALHPALWDLQAFRDIAGALSMMGDDITTRSVWAFERRSGAIPSPIPLAWQGRSYRVFGLGMLGGKFRGVRILVRRSMYFLLNFLLLVAKKIFGVAAQENLINYVIPETLFYDGPYPLYWSGAMQKGRLHKNFERYLRFHQRNDELSRFREILIPKKG